MRTWNVMQICQERNYLKIPAPSISKKVVRWYRVKTPVLFSQLCFACLWIIETALPQSYWGYFLVSHFRWNSWIHRGSSVDLICSWTVHRIIHPLSTPPNSSNAWPTHLQAHATHLSHCRAYTIMFGAQNQGPTWRKTRHLATWKKKGRKLANKETIILESHIPYQPSLWSGRWFSSSEPVRICYILFSEDMILSMVQKSDEKEGRCFHFLR